MCPCKAISNINAFFLKAVPFSGTMANTAAESSSKLFPLTWLLGNTFYNYIRPVALKCSEALKHLQPLTLDMRAQKELFIELCWRGEFFRKASSKNFLL